MAKVCVFLRLRKPLRSFKIMAKFCVFTLGLRTVGSPGLRHIGAALYRLGAPSRTGTPAYPARRRCQKPWAIERKKNLYLPSIGAFHIFSFVNIKPAFIRRFRTRI